MGPDGANIRSWIMVSLTCMYTHTRTFVPLLHGFLVYTDETQLKHPGSGVKPTGFVWTGDIARAKMRVKRINTYYVI